MDRVLRALAQLYPSSSAPQSMFGPQLELYMVQPQRCAIAVAYHDLLFVRSVLIWTKKTEDFDQKFRSEKAFATVHGR